MTNLATQLKHGAGQAWESLTEGWRELSGRAGGALTRFWADSDDTRPASEARQSIASDRGSRAALPAARWSFMAVDLYWSQGKLVVRIEAPGMAREDFQVEMSSPETLSVLGRKRYDGERSSCTGAIIQCAYGTFRRDIVLPVEVDIDRAKATYEAGVLRIELPRSEPLSTRRIPVRAA
jgi:HSP20 family protein